MIQLMDVIEVNIDMYLDDADRREEIAMKSMLARKIEHIDDMLDVESDVVELGEVPEVPGSREQRAQALLRDMYANCRETSEVGVDKHNPYAWGEANPVLMKRLKEFL